LAPEVNEAVEQAHLRGILTAASLMMGAPAAPDAVKRAKRLPGLRVGLHLVLVEGRPLLPPSEVPDLVDESGRLQGNMVKAGVSFFFRAKVRRQLAAEIEAQFEAFRSTGLSLDHVDAHKHFQLHPTVADLVVKIGRAYGVRAMRVPVEDARVLAAAVPQEPNRAARAMTAWARFSRRRLSGSGLALPDQVFGVAWSGAMTTPRLRGLLHNLPQGLTEIYLHPATTDRFEEAAPGYRYAEELTALTDPAVIAATRAPDLKLGGFADFVQS
jgi:hopanoid biosynthesis associated protein HpnK